MNYEEYLKNLTSQKDTAIANSNNIYNDLVNQNQSLLEQQNQYLDTWQQKQDEITKNQTNFNVSEIERKQAEAQKDYLKQAQAANAEYQKFINPTGVQAEYQATKGLNNTGYSESTKVNAWNTAQNRIASARESYVKARGDYDAQITQARLTGDAQLAENALKVMEKKMDNALSTFNTYSTLKQAQLTAQQQLDSEYSNRYQWGAQQLQSQKQWQAEQAESKRRWEAELAYQRERDRVKDEQWLKEYNLSLQSARSSYRSSGGSSRSGGSGGSGGNNTNLTNGGGTTGYFSNGYQPNNVKGYALHKSGYTVNQVLTGAPVKGSQNVWKADNGNYYVWVGTGNKSGYYQNVTNKVTTSIKKKQATKW